jgi:hypothetical protein
VFVHVKSYFSLTDEESDISEGEEYGSFYHQGSGTTADYSGVKFLERYDSVVANSLMPGMRIRTFRRRNGRTILACRYGSLLSKRVENKLQKKCLQKPTVILPVYSVRQ